MILDYYYYPKAKKLSISYINDKAQKSLMEFNVNRFKTYYYTPKGKFLTWEGSHSDVRWTEKPHKFDIRTYMTELNTEHKEMLNKRTFPKVYAFDIETAISEEFPDPAIAAQPITTISIASPNLNTVVFGTRKISDEDMARIQANFDEYIENTEFYHTLNIPKPSFKYVYYETEEQMLKSFLTNIVAKTSILTGWNCIQFDWQYIVNRIHNNYPDLSVGMASCKGTTHFKSYTNMKGDKISLPMPDHTLILDMMQVIAEEDKVVLPIKESMSLDYIAHETMGINKIKYKGDLQSLYDNDYPTYVYYNAIDSILVQLIDKRFKTLDHIYVYSLQCNEKIGNCFSKIHCSEALIFDDLYKNNIRIVPCENTNIDRGKLTGAYVKEPIPGLHDFLCCNDFASLYPSTIRTCNLSFENYVWKDGEFTEEELERYRKDPNYFVSVNGHVYKNDRDYCLRRIQTKLKANRDASKYLAKELDASIMLDIELIQSKENKEIRTYSDRVRGVLANIGYPDIANTEDVLNLGGHLSHLKQLIKDEITYLTCHEQAMKLLMNSIYGGSSHVSFYWFNIGLANDITGESKNLIHLMEHHIPDFVRNNWLDLKDLHKQLGVEVDKEAAMKALEESPLVTPEQDPDAYHKRSWVYAAYGDTDSCIGTTKLHLEDLDSTIEELYNKWYNKSKKVQITQNGAEIIDCGEKILNYSNDGKLEYHPIKYLMRHKVTKPKWRIKTKSGKEIIVTNDHSMIVFRDGQKCEVKPSEILPTDKILTIVEK